MPNLSLYDYTATSITLTTAFVTSQIETRNLSKLHPQCLIHYALLHARQRPLSTNGLIAEI
jgi:hypothetical protein